MNGITRTVATPAVLPTPAMSVRAMNAEAVLDESIDPYAAEPMRSGEPDAVLLTGATGFLGAFLLHELSQQTTATIYCLVRASDAVEARNRIQCNLESYSLPSELCERRVVPLVGDLRRPMLGLAPDQFDYLADTIDSVYHCGATVKWTYPYELLRDSNVSGTHEILRLASQRRRKPVHFVSTVGVFSSPEYRPDVVLETEQLDHSGPLYVGYAQTKWIAEKMVVLAGCRGLPVSIYRPNIASHSRTGAFNASDHVCLMIKGCVQLGSAPGWETKISGAPVDYVSRALVYLSRQSESLGQTFHLVGPREVPWSDMVGWIRDYGYEVRDLSFEDWRAELQAAIRTPRENALRALSPLFLDSVMRYVRLPLFDRRNALQGVAATSIRCPAIDSAFVHTMLDSFVKVGFLRGPKS